MDFIRWILQNFGLVFGPVFLLYIFLMIRRLTILWDCLRLVPDANSSPPLKVGKNRALWFLNDLFERLAKAVVNRSKSIDSVIEAIWSEVDCKISVHFTALNGYVNTLILVGFAGTIFGSIGAFNEMFRGLAQGDAATSVFVASWNSGLATALYTSLGAAAIGGVMVTVLCSRYLMTRAKRLDTIIGLRISEIITEKEICPIDTEEAAFPSDSRRTLEKTSLPISSS